MISGADPYFSLSREIYHPDERLLANVIEPLFRGVPLRGRSMLDVGGGSGLMSFYAASHGAAPVVCLEPSEAGSNPQMDETFRRWQDGLGENAPVDLVRSRFQDLEPSERFEIVLINSAINHLDEEACARLPHDPEARVAYVDIFETLAELTAPGGDLIIADAARKNMWGALGVRSPFARTIEWKIHAQPSVWAELAEESGFSNPSVTWRAHARLGGVGRVVFGNALGGWLTNSMFVLHLRRDG